MEKLVNGACQDQAGQDLTEEALLLVLIALASVTAMKGLAAAVQAVYNAAPSDPAVTT